MSPLQRAEVLVVFVTMYGAPSIETFLSADTYQTTDAVTLLAVSQPLCKQTVEVIVPEIIIKKSEIDGPIYPSRNLPTVSNMTETWRCR